MRYGLGVRMRIPIEVLSLYIVIVYIRSLLFVYVLVHLWNILEPLLFTLQTRWLRCEFIHKCIFMILFNVLQDNRQHPCSISEKISV